MDNTYWTNYYKSHEYFPPSDFAKFITKYITPGDTLIDLGCGNGRDTVYFAENNIKAIGIDNCTDLIYKLNSNNLHNNVEYVVGDLGNLSADISKPTHCYSRFSLHAIDDTAEDKLITWVANNTQKYFFIETRSDKDRLKDKTADHYRRFINLNALLFKLIYADFDIIYAELSNGFSKYHAYYNVDDNETDPILIRIVAKIKSANNS